MPCLGSFSSHEECSSCTAQPLAAHVTPAKLGRCMALCAQRVAAWHKSHQMPRLLANRALAFDALRGGFGLASCFGWHVPFSGDHHSRAYPVGKDMREAKFTKFFPQLRFCLVLGAAGEKCGHFVIIVTVLCCLLAFFHELFERLFHPLLADTRASGLRLVCELLSKGHCFRTRDEHSGLRSKTAVVNEKQIAMHLEHDGDAGRSGPQISRMIPRFSNIKN